MGENILIYEGEYTLVDAVNGPWTAIEPFSSSRHFEISGLARGKDVFAHVRARNSNGAGPWRSRDRDGELKRRRSLPW
jgi:hypothetical protein